VATLAENAWRAAFVSQAERRAGQAGLKDFRLFE
jgi:hypothetical protein